MQKCKIDLNLLRTKILNNRGSVFVMAIVFAGIFSIIGVSTIALISRGNEMHARDVEVIRSYWANEGALRVAMRYLTRTDVFLDHDIANLNAGNIIDLNGYTPNVHIDMTSTIYGLRAYDIYVKAGINSNIDNNTVVDGITLSTYNRYTYAQKSMDMLMSDMIIDGYLYSEEMLKLVQDLSNEVHVTEGVECASTFDGTPWGYPDEYGTGLGVYSGGNLTTQSSQEWFKKRLPYYKTVDPLDMGPLAPSMGTFDDGYDLDLLDPGNIYTDFLIQLKSGGSGEVFGWALDTATGMSTWVSIEEKAITSFDDGKIVTHKPVHVAGVLDGQLTIASYDNIYIAGNILYADTNIVPGNSDDILALVSDDTMMVRHDYSSYSSVGFPPEIAIDWSVINHMEIYASLFAVNKSIMAEPSLQHDWEPAWQRVHVNVFGSAMMDLTVPTFYHQNQGYEGHYVGDIRFLENLITAPGIPFPRYYDREMVDFHGISGAQRYLITHKYWDNFVS